MRLLRRHDFQELLLAPRAPYGSKEIADMVADVLDGLAKNGPENNGDVERVVNERVRELCARFPIYQG